MLDGSVANNYQTLILLLIDHKRPSTFVNDIYDTLAYLAEWNFGQWISERRCNSWVRVTRIYATNMHCFIIV